MATNATDFVWVDDEFPAGSKPGKNEGTSELLWAEQTNVVSGKRALVRTEKGVAQDFFTGGRLQPLMIGKGDILFAYVYLDPTNLPKSIMLQYHTSEWLHRANWGDDDAIPYGDKGTTKKLLLGALPEAGKWVRLGNSRRSKSWANAGRKKWMVSPLPNSAAQLPGIKRVSYHQNSAGGSLRRLPSRLGATGTRQRTADPSGRRARNH